jgi:hypothetical protein
MKFPRYSYQYVWQAVPWLKRLDAGFPSRRAEFPSGQHVGIVVDKAALGQVFSEYFAFPCQSFHPFLHHHNHPGLAHLAYWWPQCRGDPIGLHPPPPPIYQIKKYICMAATSAEKWYTSRHTAAQFCMRFSFSVCISPWFHRQSPSISRTWHL